MKNMHDAGRQETLQNVAIEIKIRQKIVETMGKERGKIAKWQMRAFFITAIIAATPEVWGKVCALLSVNM